MRLEDWFLTEDERGNPQTALDRRRSDGLAWTTGNEAELLVDGASYFRRLCDLLSVLGREDRVSFTDWQGDADERLAGPGTEVGAVLAAATRRGVDVRALLWRSHPRQVHFAEQDNRDFATVLDEAGASVLLDERVRRGGSHHQKFLLVRRAGRPENDVAFAGGTDLCHGRHDDSVHGGDEQAIQLDERYGRRPPWHDIQLSVRGPAVGDLAYCFRERWEDPTPLDRGMVWRRALRRARGHQAAPRPLPPERADPAACGTHAVQVLRTYPAKRPSYPFAPDGERSVARAYLKAFRRARRLIYIEDQYLWCRRAATALGEALRTHADLHVVAVVPRYPDRGGRASGAASRFGRQRVTELLREAGGDRFAIYDLENDRGTPIYVHAKICIIDDVWCAVGSDNVNRRSWTHDSELSCAVIDDEADPRGPVDPGGLGDRARRFARDGRIRLWCEQLGRPGGEDADLLDPAEGFAALAESAAALDAWYRDGRHGPRPAGRLRVHQPERVGAASRLLVAPVYRWMLDPDGRPRRLRRRDAY